MTTYRLDIEYNGTRYHGWQFQKNARSLTGELQSAIRAAGADMIDLGGAGRTDAGVHALRQTAHLRLRQPADPGKLRLAINDALPQDIQILALLPAADTFHARHGAVARSYLYQVARRRTALAKRYVWWVKRPLQVRAMAEAARAVVGRHDFAAFCERPQEQTSTLVVLERAEVMEAGDLILVRLVASHFLWKMVRRVVGVLVRIGAGEMAAGDLGQLLSSRSSPGGARGKPSREAAPSPVAAWTAPPAGLFLERVLYPGEAPLRALAPAFPLGAETAGLGELFTGAAAAPTPPPRPRRAPRPRR